MFADLKPIPKGVVLVYLVLIFWLCAYTWKRYNGWDYQVYVGAGERLSANLSPYDLALHQNPIRYPPPGALSFLPLQKLSVPMQHVLVFVVSLLGLFRMTYLWLRIVTPLLWVPRSAVYALYLLAPWFLVIQGIGAQFESGNINLVLLALQTEGLFQFLSKKKSLGFFLMALPTVFKPQLGLIPYFVLLSQRKNVSLKECCGGFFPILGIFLLPFLWFGVGKGWILYEEWWVLSRRFMDCTLDLSCVASNLSFYAYIFHQWGISIAWLNRAFFFPLLFIFHWPVLRATAVEAAILANLFLFFFFPASYPYTQIMLLGAVCLLWAKLLSREWRGTGHWICLFGVLISSWVVNPTAIGRALYNDYCVPWRIQTWLMLPMLIGFWMAFSKPSEIDGRR